jgi:hypothetical protein
MDEATCITFLNAFNHAPTVAHRFKESVHSEPPAGP